LALGVVGLAGIVGLWWLGSVATTFVPALGELVDAAPAFLRDADTWRAVGATTRRVAISLLAAATLAVPYAIAVHRRSFVGRVLAVYLPFLLGLPSTIVALLALFAFRRSEFGVYVVVTIVILPFLVIAVTAALDAADRQLDEIGAVYGFSRLTRFRHVMLPHLLPALISGVRNEHAHAWRVVVLAELFAVNTGMGAEFNRAFDRFRLVETSLWLLVLLTLLLLIEYLALRPTERWASRWRPRTTNERTSS
jgi:NitT/TauT family transport system permease protein